MEKKKLNREHLFLQFLMMFLALVLILSAPFFFLSDIVWFENAKTTISLVSGVLLLLLSVISIYRNTLKEKESTNSHLFSAIFFFLLGFLTIFTTLTKSLSSPTEFTITFPIILILLAIFVFLIATREWMYRDLYFWIIFSVALFIFSRVFFLQSFTEAGGLVEYSSLVAMFGYLAFLIGFGNDLYEAMKGKKSAKKGKKK